jgi:hypothetical protein
MKTGLLWVVLMCGFPALSQDYLVNWQNDTLSVTLPANPAKEDFKPGWKYRSGYELIAVIFANDSIRAINAGEIKAYYRQKHGKGLLCDGSFESIKVEEGTGKRTNAEGKVAYSWYFMQPVHKGRYASLYKILVGGKRVYTYYYIVIHKEGNRVNGQLMLNRSDARKLLTIQAHEEAMTHFIRKNKRFSKIVIEYNRLMAISSKQ